jgi:hypothetical protein
MESPLPDETKAPSADSLTEVLPTRRIAFGKQLDLLRAYAAAGAGGGPVGNQEVAELVGMSPQTTSLANGFFIACGLITRAERGFAPAPEVVRFQRAYQWSPETAAHELAPVIDRSWFAQALQPPLALGRITDAKAMAILGSASNATKHRSAELRLLIDYLEASGLIVRTDGHMRAASPDDKHDSEAPGQPPTSTAQTAPQPDIPRAQRGGALPLLIQGLLEQLPQDHRWTRVQARQWLKLAELTFDLVYDLDPDGGDSAPGPEPSAQDKTQL